MPRRGARSCAGSSSTSRAPPGFPRGAMPSLSFREKMSGSYWRLDAPTEERALSLAFEARAADLASFVRTRTCQLEGAIDAEGIARGRTIEGTIRFALLQERRVPYRFLFHGDDGRRYELSGQKEWT